MTKYTLHKYQEDARNWILRHYAAGVFLPPGMGKTLITLDAINILLNNDANVEKILLIAPIRVMYMVWRQEATKWGFDYSIGILHGKNKDQVAEQNHDIYIVNPEGLHWLFSTHKDMLRKYKFMLVIDESSLFKNHGTVRFKLMKNSLKHFTRKVLLTGTPAPNSLLQLWSQMYILDKGARLGTGITKYRERFFMLKNPNNFFDYTIIPGMEEVIYEAIDDIVMHKDKGELELPPLVYNNIEVTLPPTALTAYRKMHRNSVIELASGDGIIAVNAAAKGMALKQIANGTAYTEFGGVEQFHNEKITALLELVDTLAGNPLLVLYEFNHDLARLKGALGNPPHIGGNLPAKILAETISAWNNRVVPVLLLQPQAGAMGLNLQSGGCTDICWFSITFDLELYEQAVARVWRQGVSGTVTVHHIVAQDTIDRHVLEVLANKGNVQQALLSYLTK
jgi:SNF2 family DNA or RNA helicase